MLYDYHYIWCRESKLLSMQGENIKWYIGMQTSSYDSTSCLFDQASRDFQICLGRWNLPFPKDRWFRESVIVHKVQWGTETTRPWEMTGCGSQSGQQWSRTSLVYLLATWAGLASKWTWRCPLTWGEWKWHLFCRKVTLPTSCSAQTTPSFHSESISPAL